MQCRPQYIPITFQYFKIQPSQILIKLKKNLDKIEEKLKIKLKKENNCNSHIISHDDYACHGIFNGS